MNIFETTARFLANITKVNEKYILLTIYSIIAYLIVKIFVKGFVFLNNKFNKDDKKIYQLNKRFRVIGTCVTLIFIVLIWEDSIKNIITLISFVSAALTLAVRDIVFNFFSGIYIRIAKPFKVEDRIEIDEICGDVVNINSLNFEVLEVSNRESGEQSTGIIIQVPAYKIFTDSLKNYGKAFKYIWYELVVSIPIDSDVSKAKQVLYGILKTNDTLKRVPKKMQNQLDNAVSDYRIYYNNLDPIIYTKVVDDHIELTVRYLIHPKKSRNVESDIWNKILKAKREGKIELYGQRKETTD